MSEYGLAVPRGVRVGGPDDVAQAMTTLVPPVVLKIVSPDIVHKSDFGGVRTRLSEASEVIAAMADMTARARAAACRVDGFLLEETAPAGHELVIGAVRDDNFGWMLMFGMGGVLVEYLHDVAFRICPITRLDAVEMIDEPKASALLAGARGATRADRDALIAALLAIGGEHGLLAECGEHVRELDLNPVIASERAVVAVDARIILTDD